VAARGSTLRVTGKNLKIHEITNQEIQAMPYPEIMIRPMREDLTRLGVEELRTADAVDETIRNSKGTLMVVVNSICGCAAGKARPGVALALQNNVKPDKVATVFAGADIEATERARSYFTGYGPSSPSIALLKDGELVYMLERYQIEGRDANQIAGELTQAFEKHCSPA
jgi:putative YphP/YqiW family bacilliredoxin